MNNLGSNLDTSQMSIDMSTSGDDNDELEKEIESENLRQKEEEWGKEKEVLSKK